MITDLVTGSNANTCECNANTYWVNSDTGCVGDCATDVTGSYNNGGVCECTGSSVMTTTNSVSSCACASGEKTLPDLTCQADCSTGGLQDGSGDTCVCPAGLNYYDNGNAVMECQPGCASTDYFYNGGCVT